ncbi:hypothetical protein KY358_05775 [Candidatus Woesearchaeota archaeon]|nr:hypothetical protein [Candidatus Woesearchaeota archaeon]
MASAYNLEQFVVILDSWGLTDVMLPFLLIFVVMFALMAKTRVLGEDKKKYNLIVALVISLSVVIPHVLDYYPPEADVVEIMNRALPQVSIIAVAVVMLLILIGLFGGEAKWMGSSLSGWIGILSFIIILAIFGGAAGWWGDWSWLYSFFGGETIAVIVMILVFAIIVWWITRGEAQENKLNALSGIGKWVGDMFKKD